MSNTSSYQEDLIESLRDPCEAAAYINAALEEGDRAAFLLALRNVAAAHGGIAAFAKKTNLSWESLSLSDALWKREPGDQKSLCPSPCDGASFSRGGRAAFSQGCLNCLKQVHPLPQSKGFLFFGCGHLSVASWMSGL